MGKHTKFVKSSAVYKCNECGRRTRHVDQAMWNLCPQCDERLATINGIVDGCYANDPEGLAQAESHIKGLEEFVIAKGGKLPDDGDTAESGK